MIEIICFILLSAIIFISCFVIFSDIKLSNKFGGKILLLIAILFIIFSFFLKPKNFIRWDLIEHFKLVDNMRIGGLNYVKNKSQYANLYVYNYFAYVISLLPKNYQNLLTVIPLIIDFSIVGYIYKNMFNNYLTNVSGKVRVLSVMLWLFTFGIKLAISGIRCSLAISIATLAIYLEMIQNKYKIFSIILYLIAIFIHNFAVVVIIVRLLTLIKKPIAIIILSLTISIFLEPIARFIVNNVNNQYLVFSFERVLETIGDMSFSIAIKQYNGLTLIIYMCFIVVSIYLFVISTRANLIYYEKKYYKNVINFASTVGAVAIGLSFNYLYLERFMYLMSFALLMIIPIHNGNNGIKNENIVIVSMTIFLFFFNDIYIFMVNYLENYFLSF